MKKIMFYSLLLASSLLIANQKIQIPMPAESLSVENSGLKQPIDAYQDGVGIYTMEALGANKVDNSEMNALVFKYGDAAKELNISVKEYVQTNGTNSEKELASTVGKFEPMVPGNGTFCNDSNPLTINDKYINGVCSGDAKNIESCLDLKVTGLGNTNGYYNINGKDIYCDMTTDGGGWTLVYKQNIIERNYSNYTENINFVKNSKETMIAYANASNSLSNAVVIDTLDDWKNNFPLNYGHSFQIVNYKTLSNNQTGTTHFYYGKENFASRCLDGFIGGLYGKICLGIVPDAPFFSGMKYDAITTVYCSNSSQSYNAQVCDGSRLFVILVR